jgi:hypothetical protein
MAATDPANRLLSFDPLNSFPTVVQVVTEHGSDYKLPVPPLNPPLPFQTIHESAAALVPDCHVLWEKLRLLNLLGSTITFI